MNYWWVNHNQSHECEIRDGYLWSPKRTRNGRRWAFYDFMKETIPGDLILSYAGQQIANVGIAQNYPMSAPNPRILERNDDPSQYDGWLVNVAWHALPAPFSPRRQIEEIRNLLPERYSPIRRNGYGNQSAYLTRISEVLFKTVLNNSQFNLDHLKKTENADYEFAEHCIDMYEDEVEKQIKNCDADETEKDATIKARQGQGRFRQNVSQIEHRCRVTGCEDKRLLIAGHIKPWRHCQNNHERLDGNNGLFLAPHIDRLFDLALITFEENGDLRMSATLSENTRKSLGVNYPQSMNFGAFNEHQKRYLEYHRNFLFIDPSA